MVRKWLVIFGCVLFVSYGNFVKIGYSKVEVATDFVVFKNHGYGFTHLEYPSISSNSTHFGVDIIADYNTPIYPLLPGEVVDVKVGYSGGLGNSVLIRHPSMGENGEEDLYTIYLHMNSVPMVSKGEWVTGTSPIGYIGSTGNSSGNHTHFEIRRFFHDSAAGGNGWFHEKLSNIYAPFDARNELWGKKDWLNPEKFFLNCAPYYVDNTFEYDGQLCWWDTKDNSGDSIWNQCKNAKSWQHYPLGGMVYMEVGKSYCNNIHIYYSSVGQSGYRGEAPWYVQDRSENFSYFSDESSVPPQEETLNPGHYGGGGFNDMKIKTVTMSKGAHSKRHKTLHQKPGEKFYTYAKLDNDGSATAYDFKLKFYIDGGKRNFDRDHEDYQGSIRINEYNPDAQIRYAKELTAPNEPGIHWVYTCITSIDNDQDEENNCSDEKKRKTFGKLIVDDPHENQNTSPSGKSWDDLTQGEKAAILQIIFD